MKKISRWWKFIYFFYRTFFMLFYNNNSGSNLSLQRWALAVEKEKERAKGNEKEKERERTSWAKEKQQVKKAARDFAAVLVRAPRPFALCILCAVCSFYIDVILFQWQWFIVLFIFFYIIFSAIAWVAGVKERKRPNAMEMYALKQLNKYITLSFVSKKIKIAFYQPTFYYFVERVRGFFCM